MGRGRLLIIDDEPQIRRILPKLIAKFDCEVNSAESAEQGLNLIDQQNFDLILLDLRLPGRSGLEIIKEIKQKNPSTCLVVITAYGSVEVAIQAMKLGADDFLQKPFDTEQIRMIVRQVLERKELLKSMPEKGLSQELELELVGNSKQIQELKYMVERVAKVKSTVLIMGETGTGKELVARLIHRLSDRADKQFIVVNCAAVPGTLLESEFFGHTKGAFTDAVENKPGFFEVANGGTIFLDEIGELDFNLQAKLLRVLEEGEVVRLGSTKPISVDVRIITATNRDLRQMVEEKKFRQDFYYRLSVIPIMVPPLREHKEDLLILISHILSKLRKGAGLQVNGVSQKYLEILKHYNFPGNVRELENIIEHSVLLAGEQQILTPETIPDAVLQASGAEELAKKGMEIGLSLKQAKALATEQMESKLIQRMLNECGNNFSLTARKLGISRSALYYKIKKYKINLE